MNQLWKGIEHTKENICVHDRNKKLKQAIAAKKASVKDKSKIRWLK